MAVITKKVGNRSYVYLSTREGDKIIHKYLGPADDPNVEKNISALRETKAVPEKFRSLFWDTRPENIHLKRNGSYVIERVLELGDLDAIRWLRRVYPTQRILQVLTTSRTLSMKSRNFWRLWFGLENS